MINLSNSQKERLERIQLKPKNQDQVDRFVKYMTALGFSKGVASLIYNGEDFRIGFFRTTMFSEDIKQDYTVFSLVGILFELSDIIGIPVKVKTKGSPTLVRVKDRFKSDIGFVVSSLLIKYYFEGDKFIDCDPEDSFIELDEEEFLEYANTYFNKQSEPTLNSEKMKKPEYVTLNDDFIASAFVEMTGTQREELMKYFNPVTKEFPVKILEALVGVNPSVVVPVICGNWIERIKEEILSKFEQEDDSAKLLYKAFDDKNISTIMSSFMCGRTFGNLSGQGLYLNQELDWEIVTDDRGMKVLTCKKKS